MESIAKVVQTPEPIVTIRNYKATDYAMILSWWEVAKEVAPKTSMLPRDTTFIAEIDGQPALAVSLYLTNTREFCIVENFIGNPELKNNARRSATKDLLRYLEIFASQLGYKSLISFGSNSGIQSYYKTLGFVETLSGLSSFKKELQ